LKDVYPEITPKTVVRMVIKTASQKSTTASGYEYPSTFVALWRGGLKASYKYDNFSPPEIEISQAHGPGECRFSKEEQMKLLAEKISCLVVSKRQPKTERLHGLL